MGLQGMMKPTEFTTGIGVDLEIKPYSKKYLLSSIPFKVSKTNFKSNTSRAASHTWLYICDNFGVAKCRAGLFRKESAQTAFPSHDGAVCQAALLAWALGFRSMLKGRSMDLYSPENLDNKRNILLPSSGHISSSCKTGVNLQLCQFKMGGYFRL